MLTYKAIEIFINEEAHYRRKPLVDAVIEYIRGLKIAARCMVTRGVAGCYENGEITTRKLEILSYNLPVRIYIVLPAAATELVLEGLDPMIDSGIVVLHDLDVVFHRTRSAFFPRQLLVRDVMTPKPKSVPATDPLGSAAELLLSSIFTGLPVVDPKGRPLGVITQGDLMTRAGVPLRLGLLREAGHRLKEKIFKNLEGKKAAEAMTSPAITISEEQLLAEGVNLMLERNVKRLPVVDNDGRLSGMLSRLDIFRTVMREAPDWKSFRAQKIEVDNLKTVHDILRRDTRTVSPETTVDEVIRIIDQNDIQRVAVIDEEGRLLGLISDSDLLIYFRPKQEGIWRLLAKAKQPFSKDPCPADLEKCLVDTRAADVMKTELIVIGEEALIEEAIGLMTEKALKRLPVVDDAGRFKGMISRDSLLRTGVGRR